MKFGFEIPRTRAATLACVVGGVIAAAPLMALAEVDEEKSHAESPHTFSANVTMATEYVFRGITQTNEDPAIQGGFDYSHSSGFYIGTWASNLEFNAQTTDSASIEIDIYGGFAGEFSNGVGWDVGGLYYWYPSQNEDSGGGDYDYVEAYGNLSYTFGGFQYEPSVEVGFAWSPEFFGEDNDGFYYHGTFSLALPAGFSPYVVLGYQDVDGGKTTGPKGFDYFHYTIGVSKELGMFTADLSWQDADLNGCGDFCEAVVFSLSSSW